MEKQQAETRAKELITQKEMHRIYARKGSGVFYSIILIEAMEKSDSKDDWEVIITSLDSNKSPSMAEETLFYGTHFLIPNKGDVVRLKSGGPDMTVDGFSYNQLTNSYYADRHECTWFDGKNTQKQSFKAELLELVRKG